MILSSIEALAFRNLKGSLSCAPGLNILFGDNGQGKTAWLEAIYILGNTKSFRTNHLHEVINHDESTAILRATVYQGTVRKELQAQIDKSTKAFFVNGKREPLTRFIGNLDVFAFTNDELAIIRGEPAERRRFLDRGISILNPSFIQVLNSYNRVLKQKGILLKSAQDSEDHRKFIPLIEPWNQQLVEFGTEIHKARVDYVNRLSASLNPSLFGDESVTIRYKSSLEQHGDLNDYFALFRARLDARLNNEIALGYSLVGPHKDELTISLDDRDIQSFGSSGQQRSALLILVLAQISLYNDLFEEYPIFLLDDIDAELDPGRIKRVLEHLDGKTQTFISTSKRDIAGWSSGAVGYRKIEGGKATEESVTAVARDQFAEIAPTELPVADMPTEDAAAEDYECEVDPHAAPF